MQQTEERQFESNQSFVEGRMTEMVIIRFLEKHGLIVKGTKANQQHYDVVIIDPAKDLEYVGQIKSSKTRVPYIRCVSEQGLIQVAKDLNAIPLIILSFTTDRKFVIFNALNKLILFSNHDEYIKDQPIQFQCWNKDR